jgi:hypothetical protein
MADPIPHEEALAFLAGKPVVSSEVFYALLPELRARVFTVSGIYGADVLQRIRERVASIAAGESDTWDTLKKEIIADLEPYLGDDAEQRAEVILRANTYQAFQAANWNVAQRDEDTTHLQYLHGFATVPTPEHLALHGIILPKDDPFWDDHYGPWGHLGCVCSARPMNLDLVEAAREADADKNPEDQRVIEGAALDALRDGRLIRGTQTYDVAAPAGPDAFSWSPGTLTFDLESLQARYDPEVWAEFEARAKTIEFAPGQTIWDWLNAAR